MLRGFTSDAQDLREIRDILREHEGGQLAQVALTLLEIAEKQQELLGRLEKLSRPAIWTDRKGIREHLGYRTEDQFRAVADEIPKHQWRGQVYLYNILEVDEWMRSR